MRQLLVEDFSLFHTLDSGQLFTYYQDDDFYIVLANNAVFKLKQEDKTLFFDGKKIDGSRIEESDIIHLFAFDEDQSFPITDPYLSAAKEKFHGLRIMKQDPYDATIAFMISQMNNIPRITQLSNELLKDASRTIEFEDKHYRLFPLPSELPSEEALREKKFGYRAKYISNLRHAEEIFPELKKKNYDEAKKDLMELMGVGSKVADCILLFSLKHYNAFPVDTHINKMMKLCYKVELEKEFGKQLEDIGVRDVENFGKRKFGGKAGIIQQYLFQYSRRIRD